MSFITAATAILGTAGAVGIGTTMLAGAMMGGAVTIGTNLIRGNDPFDNIGQGLLIGGIGGAFNPAAGAATGAAEGVTTAATTGNAAADVVASTASAPISGMPVESYGLTSAANPVYTLPEKYWSMMADAGPGVNDAPNALAGQIADTEASAVATDNTGGLRQGQVQGQGLKLSGGQGMTAPGYTPSPRAYDLVPPAQNYLTDAGSTNIATSSIPPYVKLPTSTASPKITDDLFGYLTHKDNRLPVAVGGLGVASAMGAFSPKTGLNLPPRTFEVANTTYTPGTVNPNFGKPGQPYFLGQGYGPMTRETRTVAAGGGIRALSEGGYVPMPSRGFMTNKESVPDSADDSASFKRYLKSDINKDEEKGQAAIDKTVMAWLERHAKSDIKGMAEGGLSNLPAVYQQPQYQMSDFTNSPLFQPTGGNAPVPEISKYIANMNQYTPPAPAAAPVPAVIDTTSPILYNQNTQRFLNNLNYAAPVAPVAPVDNNGGDEGSGDKAGGPIKSRRYAMGGLAALPEYAAGGQLLSGDGDGMSDSIPAVIKGARPQRAALADGEFVIPADVVSHLGNGSTKAGGKRLYEMMATIRKARTGNSKQGKQINPMKFIPA